ncbi:MAG: response regulator transcription factor [Burkholderiaceae bacterium]|jgi:DNA-binding response OmpR family regulator
MRLLLIEDDTHIARELLLRWRDSDRLAQHAPTLAQADEALAQAAFDIVLLDLGLPDGDGMEWLGAYRERDPQGAVLVMTARDRVADRVKGLRLGADDYLVKPFAPEELDARIDVLVRRANVARTQSMRFGRLDLIQETSEVLLDGKRLDMSPREFELLLILMRAAPRLVTKRALVDALSERNLDLNDAAAELYVSRLRKKLEGTGTGIRTLRGVGYQLAISGPAPSGASEGSE